MKIVLKVSGMHCEGCEKRIKNVLMTLPNVISVNANHELGQVEISAQDNIDLEIIKEKIADLGFSVIEKD